MEEFISEDLMNYKIQDMDLPEGAEGWTIQQRNAFRAVVRILRKHFSSFVVCSAILSSENDDIICSESRCTGGAPLVVLSSLAEWLVDCGLEERFAFRVLKAQTRKFFTPSSEKDKISMQDFIRVCKF